MTEAVSSASAQLAAIVSDYERATQTLLSSLDHVSNSNPPPELRVLFLNSSIVTLVSITEETIRNLFHEYLGVLQANVSSHTSLRDSLQKSNVQHGVKALAAVDIPGGATQARDLISKLEACLSGGPAYFLFRAELTYNRGNFKSAQLTDVAKNCGISEIIGVACDCPEFSELLGFEDVPRKITSFTAAWNELFAERDIVVHRISQASGWADHRIRVAVEFCQKAISRLADCLAADADGFAEAVRNKQQRA